VVAPVFNEEEGISEFVKRLYAVCYDTPGYRFEIILVNDGSTDHTSSELQILKRKFPLRLITLNKNCGQQRAILVGLRNARGRAAIVMDSDLQDPPEYIPILIRKWQEGADAVMCARRNRSDGLIKKLTAKTFYRFLHLLDKKLPIDCGDFYLINRQIINCLARFHHERIYLRGLVARSAQKRVIITIDRSPRAAGKSNYTVGKMLSLAGSGLTFTIKGYDR